MKISFICIGLLLLVHSTQATVPRFPAFKPVVVDTDITIGYGVTTADVDADGKLDILLADKDQVVWYQNPTWKKHILSEKLTQHDFVCLAAQNVGGEEKVLVAVGAEWNPSDTVKSGALFYLKPPSDPTQLWKPIALPHEPTVHRMRWIRSADGPWQLAVLPLHGRGNHPATGEGVGVKFQAYTKPSQPKSLGPLPYCPTRCTKPTISMWFQQPIRPR